MTVRQTNFIKGIALRASESIVSQIREAWSISLGTFFACLSISLAIFHSTFASLMAPFLHDGVAAYFTAGILLILAFIALMAPVDIGGTSTIPLHYRSAEPHDVKEKLGSIKIWLEELGFECGWSSGRKAISCLYDLSRDPYKLKAFKLRLDLIPIPRAPYRILLNVYTRDGFIKLLWVSLSLYFESLYCKIKKLYYKPELVPRTLTAELREDIYLILEKVLLKLSSENLVPEIAV